MRKSYLWLALSVTFLLYASLALGAGRYSSGSISRDPEAAAAGVSQTPSSASAQLRDPVQEGKNLSCTISATNQPWNPPGVMDVSIDGASIGSFKFGPNGSDALDFSSTAGKHGFTFEVEGTNFSCSASFTVSANKTKFSPMMRISPDGKTYCGLQ